MLIAQARVVPEPDQGEHVSRVLIVGCDRRARERLAVLVRSVGHRVVGAGDHGEALQRLAEQPVELVLLDVIAPDLHEFQLLTELQTWSSAPPVIVVSRAQGVAVRVAALDRGAVDYVPRPFHPAELLARIRRRLAYGPCRRGPGAQGVLHAGPVELDLGLHRAQVHGVEVSLTSRECELLAYLMWRQGELCPRDELLGHVWGTGRRDGSNVVDVYMRRLRLKLGEAIIETVRGVGYCLPVVTQRPRPPKMPRVRDRGWRSGQRAVATLDAHR